METKMVFKGLVCSLIVSLAGSVGADAAPKRWFCQAVCVGVDPAAQRVQVLGRAWALRPYRMQAFLEADGMCHEFAASAGLSEGTLSQKISYRSMSRSSGSESWSASAQTASAHVGASWGYREVTQGRKHRHDEQAGGAFESEAESRSVSRAESRTYSLEYDFSLTLMPAMMTDGAVCSLEELPANWTPPYQPMPGEQPPQG